MYGLLIVDKPAGMTSHDVVARVRRVSGQRRIGHAGTLDPMATGVLVLALGAATRLIAYVQEETRKTYLAHVQLGAITSSDDADGEILATSAVPPLTSAQLDLALDAFRGEIQQVPPMVSALHHEGQRLYDLARRGIEVDRPARPVIVYDLALLEYQEPTVELTVTCGTGTYIRAIARDLGAALGCGAHLAALRRTAVGTFTVGDAVPLAELMDGGTTAVLRHLLPPETAVADWLRVELDAAAVARIRNGLPVPADSAADLSRARGHAPDGSLLTLLRRDADRWQPEKVFSWT